MTAWDFFDPTHVGFIEIYPSDRCSEMMAHIGPPLGKNPMPDYWLESMRLQLLRISKKSITTGYRHVALMDFMVCLVTRAMGLEAMSGEERDAYLAWVRSTSNSQLACLFRDMIDQGVLSQGAELYVQQKKEKERSERERKAKLEHERTALSKDEKIELLLKRSGKLLHLNGMSNLPSSDRGELTYFQNVENEKRRTKINFMTPNDDLATPRKLHSVLSTPALGVPGQTLSLKRSESLPMGMVSTNEIERGPLTSRIGTSIPEESEVDEVAEVEKRKKAGDRRRSLSNQEMPTPQEQAMGYGNPSTGDAFNENSALGDYMKGVDASPELPPAEMPDHDQSESTFDHTFATNSDDEDFIEDPGDDMLFETAR